MKRFRVSVFVLLAVCTAAPAWAQYGLYGAPDMLRLPPAQPAVVGNGATVAPMAYQADPASQGAVANNSYALVPADASQPMAQGAMPPQATPPLPPPPSDGQPKPMSPTPAYTPAPVAAGPSATDGSCLPSYSPSYLGCGAPGCGAGNSSCGLFGGGWDGCNACNGCPWYADVLGLAMTRDRANKLWTCSDANTPALQLLNTQDASAGWAGGAQVTFGRYFCCNQWSVEATYWGLAEMTGCASVMAGAGDGIGTPLNGENLWFGAFNADHWFNSAVCQTLQRNDDVQDVEINFVRHHLLCECGCPLSVDLSAGIRFFHFRDNLLWGASCEANESWAYLRDQTENNLIGGQIGFNVEYRLCNRLKLFVTPTFGLFDNYLTNEFRANMGSTCGTQSIYPGLTYPVESHCDSFSVLTQVDAGIDWQITQCLSARLGYRVVSVTGVGLADNQIPFYLNDIPAIQDIDRNGSLVVHGAFAGLTYCF